MEAVAARLGEAGAERGRRLDLRAAAAAAGTTVVYLAGALAAAGREPRRARSRVPRRRRVGRDCLGDQDVDASFYKGQTAIFAQALRSARSNGVLDLVLDDLRRHYPDLVEDAPRQLQSIAAKSGRFVAEMDEIAASQEAGGSDA